MIRTSGRGIIALCFPCTLNKSLLLNLHVQFQRNVVRACLCAYIYTCRTCNMFYLVRTYIHNKRTHHIIRNTQHRGYTSSPCACERCASATAAAAHRAH